MSEPFRCTRCEREDARPLDSPPFPTDLGARVLAEICADCWDEWKERQMLLINHYGLQLQKAESRDFLYANMKAFLFGEGEMTGEIDTSQEGTVEW